MLAVDMMTTCCQPTAMFVVCGCQFLGLLCYKLRKDLGLQIHARLARLSCKSCSVLAPLKKMLASMKQAGGLLYYLETPVPLWGPCCLVFLS